MTVTRQLGLLQRDRPWTAITVKTKQATTSTLNVMLLDAVQLKEEGNDLTHSVLLFVKSIVINQRCINLKTKTDSRINAQPKLLKILSTDRF